MELLIGIILLIITLLIVGLILRKRVYDAVDRLEIWKMDIMNRNTASQLARMKGLNLSGEALEKFETWKDKWEFIITKELPDIEDYLFKAEDLADRYRFPSAHKILHKIEQSLESIENNIEEMLEELDGLLLSEEKSREKIQLLKPILKDLRKDILHNHYQFGNGIKYFENVINTLEQRLINYDELVHAGDYTKAKELVDQLEIDIEKLEKKMTQFPEILKLCTTYLPNQIDDLENGIQEMKDDGYRIDQLGVEKELKQYKLRLQDCKKSLENGKIAEISTIITEMEDRIQEIYDLLEKEAIARNYVETKLHGYEQTLNELGISFDDTRLEVEKLRKSYYFDDRDMESFLLLEKSIHQSKKKLDELSHNIHNKDKAHSELREQLEIGFKQLEELQDKHEEFKIQINNLRKDEIKAKEKLQFMTEQIYELQRKLQRSNIPGVPNYIWTTIEKASNSNNQVINALEKQPLDIAEVYHILEEADSDVTNAIEQVDTMLEQAYLTEQVIQYANRYRSKYPILAAKLSESERLFRSYEYELSLEQAVEAIEEIEPGALRHIEANQKAL